MIVEPEQSCLVIKGHFAESEYLDDSIDAMSSLLGEYGVEIEQVVTMRERKAKDATELYADDLLRTKSYREYKTRICGLFAMGGRPKVIVLGSDQGREHIEHSVRTVKGTMKDNADDRTIRGVLKAITKTDEVTEFDSEFDEHMFKAQNFIHYHANGRERNHLERYFSDEILFSGSYFSEEDMPRWTRIPLTGLRHEPHILGGSSIDLGFADLGIDKKTLLLSRRCESGIFLIYPDWESSVEVLLNEWRGIAG